MDPRHQLQGAKEFYEEEVPDAIPPVPLDRYGYLNLKSLTPGQQVALGMLIGGCVVVVGFIAQVLLR
jgi:hypothetical protein